MRINCVQCGTEFNAAPAVIKKCNTRFCSRACKTACLSGYSNPVVFWAKTIKRESGCIEWRGPFAHNGYGRTYSANSKRCAAHRLAWILTSGPIPDGMYILHKCDNPKCCNPEHLFMGTLKENSEDMVRKGRHRTNNPGGVNAKGSKFTAVQVRHIRQRIDNGEPKLRIAKEFNVGWVTIQHMYTGETYGDV